MKKVCMVFLAVIICVAFTSAVFGQAKPATAPEKAPPEKAAPAPEKAVTAPEKAAKAEQPAKPKMPGYFVGKVVRLYTVWNILGVKAGKAEVNVDITKTTLKGYKNVDDIRNGDRVAVKYTKDGISVKKVGSAAMKAKKKAVKEEKK